MKTTILILPIAAVFILFFPSNGDVLRKNGICPWQFYRNSSSCSRTNFLCWNGECIDRAYRCDGVRNCKDGSDEKNCYESPYGDSGCFGAFAKCPGSNSCIPKEWLCDGSPDCKDNSDEASCEDTKCDEHCAKMKALQWLKAQRRTQSATEMWGSFVDKFAVALYMAQGNTLNEEVRKEMAYEVSIQLLSKLSNNKMVDISSSDLASYINALLVTCLNPRKFHGYDIIRELRSRLDSRSHTNPYALLALCNAGETFTDVDVQKLIDVFRAERRTFWTDMKAIVVMTLACASKLPGNTIDSKVLRELALELKNHQYRNGTVENIQTTALVLQAIFSAEPDTDLENFDEERALKQLLDAQLTDGSFGSLANTYYVLPVLSCASLGNVRSYHCDFDGRDDTSAQINLNNRSGPKIQVRFSLWIGNEGDLERHLALKVPTNTSFYGVMEVAAEVDSRYRFEYVVKNRKPYINALSGLQDDPEKGKFWFLCSMADGKPEMASASPADVTPKDNDHFVMWYRSESWID